eukprot:541630-Hanusia_phi.AAC.1
MMHARWDFKYKLADTESLSSLKLFLFHVRCPSIVCSVVSEPAELQGKAVTSMPARDHSEPSNHSILLSSGSSS